jgi:hypothetical protein
MRLTGDPGAAATYVLAARSCLRAAEALGWYGLIGVPALVAAGACAGLAARARPQGWASSARDLHAAAWVLAEAYGDRDVQGLAFTALPVAILLLGDPGPGAYAACAACVYAAGALALAAGRGCAALGGAGALGAAGTLLHAVLAVAAATAAPAAAPAARVAWLVLAVVATAPLLCGGLLTLPVAACLLAAAGRAAAALAATYSHMQAYLAALAAVVCVYHPALGGYGEALSSALLLLSLLAVDAQRR